LLDFKQFLGAFVLILINIISVYYYIRIIKVIFFETKNINPNNLEFQMTYPIYFYQANFFVLACLLTLLVFIFVYPTFFLC